MADSYDAVDRKLRQMEKKLSRIYSRAEKEIGESWKSYLAEVDKALPDLQGKYDEAKKSGNKDDQRKYGRELTALKRERTLGNEYYRDLTAQTARQISEVNKTAAANINDELPEVYSVAYNGTGAKLSEDVYDGISFTMTDANTVKRLATEDKTLLPYKGINGKKDVRWNTQKINSEVLQGIIQGEPMPKIAKRLESVLGMNETSAIRNARTAVTGAENRGRLDMLRDAEKKGVHTKKVWSAIHDNRTRHSHAELDGQEAEIEEPFISELGAIMIPGDPDAEPANTYNCRCRLTYKVVGFRKEENRESISLLSEEERETYAERRRERIAARRQETVNFDTAPISDVQKYAETKLKTNIDFKGATEQAKRGLVKAVDRFEKAGGTVGNAKVVFGGTLGNYGYYDPKTNTIHLRTNDNFVEKMLEENARSMFKLGKPRWADPTYEGMAAHELGHAFDRYFGQEISREISKRGLLREAFSISSYAATEPAIGSPRASEAVAENIAAYLAGGAEKEKINHEIIKILEEYFGKRK